MNQFVHALNLLGQVTAKNQMEISVMEEFVKVIHVRQKVNHKSYSLH
jgi:hypothetical protein